MREYIMLPNGSGVNILDGETINELVRHGKLEIMTNNYVFEDGVYSLYFSKKTGCLYGLQTAKLNSNLKRVYKRNGLNCVDMNDTYTYLPDDLSKVDGIYIDGVFYVKVTVVKTTV